MKRAILILKDKLAHELSPILPLANYQVISVQNNGIEALRMAQRLEPDLIICGWDVGGLASSDLIQNLVHSRLCPVILILDEKNFSHLHLAVKSNVHHICTTPIRAMDILAGITQAEYRYQAEAEGKREINKLREEIKTRKILYQAICKLITTGLSEEAAYSAIRSQAMVSRKTISAIATDVLKGVWSPHE